MIATINPAFTFLRKHKQVSEETEELVMKKVRNRLSPDELFTVFENGIAGQYGKIYSLDPQTLIGWVNQYQNGKQTAANYLSTGLLSPSVGITHREYPTKREDWQKEANKCFTAFLRGVSESNFHPHVYDSMMLDGKIELNQCMKYVKNMADPEEITRAKQTVLRDCFLSYKSMGWITVYFIQ